MRKICDTNVTTVVYFIDLDLVGLCMCGCTFVFGVGGINVENDFPVNLSTPSENPSVEKCDGKRSCTLFGENVTIDERYMDVRHCHTTSKLQSDRFA